MSDTEQLTNIEEAAAEAKKEEKKAAPKVIPRFFYMSFYINAKFRREAENQKIRSQQRRKNQRLSVS